MSHTHIFGVKGRDPRPGDLCLSCPAVWRRGIAGYLADGYRPRTRAHTPTPKPQETAA